MSTRYLLLLLLLTLIPLPQLDAQPPIPLPYDLWAPWPMWQHDPLRTGLSPYKGPQTNRTKWVSPDVCGRGYYAETASPVIGSDGTIYIACATRAVAIDPTNGRVKWSSPFPTEKNSWTYTSPAIGPDGAILFATYDADDNGYLISFYPDGRVRVSDEKLGEPIGYSGHMIVDPNPGITYVYVPSGVFHNRPGVKSYLYAIHQRGRAVDRYKLDDNYNDYYGASPAYDPSREVIYVLGSRGTFNVPDVFLFALHRKTVAPASVELKLLWARQLNETKVSPPTVGPDGTIYTVYSDGIFAFKPDGTLKWKREFPGLRLTWKRISCAIGPSGTLHCIIGYELGTYDPRNGNLLWKYTASVTREDWEERARAAEGHQPSPPVVGSDGTVYFSIPEGFVYAVGPDGKLKWRFKADKYPIVSSLAIGPDGTLYFATYHGTVYAIKDVSIPGATWPTVPPTTPRVTPPPTSSSPTSSSPSATWAPPITGTTTSQPSSGAPFTLDLNPDTLTVAKGELAQFSVLVTRAAGFTGDVRLFASGIPPGSTSTFLMEGQNVYLRIQTSRSTPSGSYPITVRGSGGGYETQDTATLVVGEATQTTTPQPAPSFSLSLSQSSIEVLRGRSVSLTASVIGSGGFSNPVTLSVSGLPNGVSISTDINNAPPDFNAHLIVSASPNAPTGSYSVSIIATGGGVTKTAPLRVVVREAPASPTTSLPQPSVSLSLSRTNLSLRSGESASIAVTVSSSVPVNLSLSGAPADISYRFDPERLEGSGTSSLLITAGSTTGTFTLLIRASGEGAEGSATLSLSVRPAETAMTTTEVKTAPAAQLDPLLLAIIALSFIALVLTALLLTRRRTATEVS
ncbi:MAG: PQQ-binding-like beta-propeller repeat protein [Candidatus Korarchaeum sp.]